MPGTTGTRTIKDIDFQVVYSGRRTLGISVLHDASVIVRVPYRTSEKTIKRIVEEKASWIIKHRDNYRNHLTHKSGTSYLNGTTHMFRGNLCILRLEITEKPFVRFNCDSIEMGLGMINSEPAVKKLLYKGYKNEAAINLPLIMNRVLEKHKEQRFSPTGLVIRSMKRRWGSCSNRGKVTLSTELIKLSDQYIEYVIIHELCHLKHHNHGPKYYGLLSELYPDWRNAKKEMRRFIQY